MKKFAFILMAAIASLGFMSCNSKSSDNFAQATMFASAQSGAQGLFFETDHGQKLLVTEYLPTNYYPSWGDRMVFTYKVMKNLQTDPTNTSGFDFEIKIFEALKVRWGGATTISESNELDMYGEGRLSFQLMQWSKKSLNFYAVPNGTTKGIYTLVYNEDPSFKPKYTEEGYINFILCHDTSTGQTTSNYDLGEFLSIDLTEFADKIEQEGSKGFIIEATNEAGKKDYLRIDWAGLQY